MPALPASDWSAVRTYLQLGEGAGGVLAPDEAPPFGRDVHDVTESVRLRHRPVLGLHAVLPQPPPAQARAPLVPQRRRVLVPAAGNKPGIFSRWTNQMQDV
eukprot:4822470-Pyramimonas_sp.AAC.1